MEESTHDSENQPSLEQLRTQDLGLIRKTRHLYQTAFLQLSQESPERFGDLSFDQFQLLYTGYILSAVNKVCEKYGIDISEVVSRM